MAQCNQFFSKRKLELTKPCCTDQTECFLIRTAGQFFCSLQDLGNSFQLLSRSVGNPYGWRFLSVNITMRKYILATQESKCCWALFNLRDGTELIKTTPLLIHRPHFLGPYRRMLVLGPYSQAWPTYRAHLSSSLPSIMRNPSLQFLFRSVWSETILVLILAEFFVNGIVGCTRPGCSKLIYGCTDLPTHNSTILIGFAIRTLPAARTVRRSHRRIEIGHFKQ